MDMPKVQLLCSSVFFVPFYNKIESRKLQKFIAQITSKINQNNFAKSDFDKLSKDFSLININKGNTIVSAII